VVRPVSWLSLVFLSLSCAHKQPPANTGQWRLAKLARETTVTLPSGATFITPQGWWLSGPADALKLEDPDHAVKVFVLESGEPDAEKAIAAAWARVEPGFALVKLHAPDRPPPIGGWDSDTEIDYRTPAADHRVVHASARRYGGVTYVALVDGDRAANDRRQQQIDAVLSLRPRGMRDESLAGLSPRTIDPIRARSLDRFIESARVRLGVPGAAVAVVKEGQVVYQRSFGVRALGRPEAVTERTLFMIGSITKPMTTLMEASLVDAGVLKWTTPVTMLLPNFALADPAATRRLELWHMSCMCVGMPRRDLEDLFEYEGVTPEQRIASMKTMAPTTGFGETFQYSNLLVAAGGFAAAHAFAPNRALADAYASAMKERVFEPIGMASTTLDFRVVERADHAEPHSLDIDGVPHQIPLAYEHDVLPIAPAGGVWTNLVDLERYVVTELERGVAPNGKRVVSEANLDERLRVRVGSGGSDGYGLGIGVGHYHDLKLLEHDGGSFGFGTTMFLLPEHRIAILVLTNIRNGDDYDQLPFNGVVVRRVIEDLFDGARAESQMRLDYLVERQRRAATERTTNLDRAPDAAWRKRLAGRYFNADLGWLTLREDGVIDAGEWKSASARRIEGDGTVKLVLIDAAVAGWSFTVGNEPTLTAVDSQLSYLFRRAP
jgi:CubicO group peptidase (beta-lactamase class C family)